MQLPVKDKKLLPLVIASTLHSTTVVFVKNVALPGQFHDRLQLMVVDRGIGQRDLQFPGHVPEELMEVCLAVRVERIEPGNRAAEETGGRPLGKERDNPS